MKTATGRKLLAYGKGTGRKLEFYYIDVTIKKDLSAGTEKVKEIKKYQLTVL